VEWRVRRKAIRQRADSHACKQSDETRRDIHEPRFPEK
jgi:hypothetical protein